MQPLQSHLKGLAPNHQCIPATPFLGLHIISTTLSGDCTQPPFGGLHTTLSNPLLGLFHVNPINLLKTDA